MQNSEYRLFMLKMLEFYNLRNTLERMSDDIRMFRALLASRHFHFHKQTNFISSKNDGIIHIRNVQEEFNQNQSELIQGRKDRKGVTQIKNAGKVRI